MVIVDGNYSTMKESARGQFLIKEGKIKHIKFKTVFHLLFSIVLENPLPLITSNLCRKKIIFILFRQRMLSSGLHAMSS